LRDTRICGQPAAVRPDLPLRDLG